MLGVGALAKADPAAPPLSADDPAAADPYAPERDAWVVLASLDRLGPVAFAALLDRFGTGAQIMEVASRPGGVKRLMATPGRERDDRRYVRWPITPALAAAIADAAARSGPILARVRALGIIPITAGEARYPRRLAGIEMPPHVLFVSGDPTVLDRQRAVAVVGTRRATSFGRATAGRIATVLTHVSATVVSGLAYGIDGAAHEATVRAGGTTVAVIGGGHTVAMPRGHDRLAQAILRAGGAIASELAPDVVPSKGTFPRRNRIISGLADATIVVEAPARSGALITGSWALEQGRACYIVPGPLDAPASAGCLGFLREFHDEARIVAGIPQLIADLGYTADLQDAPRLDALASAALETMGGMERRVAHALVDGLTTADELMASLDMPVATVLATLTLLERRGLAVGVHGRYRPAGALLGEIRRPILR